MMFLALNRTKYEHYQTFLTKIIISLKNIALTKINKKYINTKIYLDEENFSE
jgi:hypothetical protein